MNINRIDDLLELYFEGETSINQEQELKSYFNSDRIATEHLSFKSMFNYLSEAQKIELNQDVSIESGIDYILDKYFEGESSIEEEKTLKRYFESDDVAERHEPFTSLFSYFIQSKDVILNREIRMGDDIDELLEKYFEGESSIEEERTLKAYFNSGEIADDHKQFSHLFEYFSTAQAENLEKGIELDLTRKAKKSQLRIIRNRIISVAAAMILVIGSIFIMRSDMNQQADMLTDSERIEAEEALETTMEALAMLGVQFNKGTESLENIKALKKTKILKN